MEPLDLREVAERWGWKYGTAADRIYKAANSGKLRVIQRPGRQKYYLSDELEALFGTPPPSNNPIGDRNPDKTFYARSSELAA